MVKSDKKSEKAAKAAPVKAAPKYVKPVPATSKEILAKAQAQGSVSKILNPRSYLS
jgi:hypothetical protein